MPDLPAALIVGGHFHSLGAARNLAAHGVRVYVVDEGPCVCRYSRAVRHCWRCPAAGDGLIDYLYELGEREALRGAVLFASDDEGVRAMAQHRARLAERYRPTTPTWDVVRAFYDKRLTCELARERGVPMPATYVPASEEALDALPLDWPVVLKPAITPHLTSVTKKKAYRADDREQLHALYRVMAAVVDPGEILVQEHIPGRAENLYSYVGFFRDGVAVAGLEARRPRQHPMEFGRASTFVEVVALPELASLAAQLMAGSGYTGLAEIEFMYDPKHGRFELLEVNPRLWGWHTVAIRAGLHLPYMAYADAVGLPYAVGTARVGAKWVRLVTDVPTAISEILGGRLTLGRYLRSLRGDTECAVFSWRDPLPFGADLWLVPHYLKRRGI